MSPRQLIQSFLRAFDVKLTSKWFLLSTAVGVVAGLGAFIFQLLCQVVLRYGLGLIAGYHAAEPAGEHDWFPEVTADFSIWSILVVMVLGGIISGWIVYTFAPEAEGHGTDAAIEAFHHKRGEIRPRIPIVKMISSAVTIGTGGSGGREGPIAQIGAGFGSYLATRLNLSARDRRIMLAAGMGAGVGAIFRAPLAGALFAGEILYKDAEFESDSVVPAAIASIVSYTVYCLTLPAELRFTPLFGADLSFQPLSPVELVPLAALALLLALAAIVYIKMFYFHQTVFRKLSIQPQLRPAVGAAIAGVFALTLFYAAGQSQQVLAVLSTGYGILQDALNPNINVGVGVLLVIALGKILTTSWTIGSGGSGGVFGPSMVIGGCVGGAAGQLLHDLWPTVVTQPHAYVIVGMAGFFAACAHAPISTLIMVSEMTGDYKLLLPVMWVSTLCFLFCRRWTIYEKQVENRLESPAHRGDFIIDLLEGIKVQTVFDSVHEVQKVPESTALDRIVHLLAETPESYFPVVNQDDELVGIFTANDVRAFIYDESIWAVAVARDVMTSNVLSVTPEDDLNTAMRRFTQRNIEELPVVDSENPKRLLGMLRRKETIAFYNRRLQDLKTSAD